MFVIRIYIRKGGTVEMLEKYIIALTNLYGMIRKDMVVDIYNRQNNDKITIEQIDVYFNDRITQIPKTEIYTYGTYFAHLLVVEFDNFTRFIRGKEDKPFYLPAQEDLLKYVNDSYFDKTESYYKLCNYVREHIFGENRSGAGYFCDNLYLSLKQGVSVDAIMSVEFERLQIELSGDFQDKIVYGLLLDFSQDVRNWENNGYTERELSLMNSDPDSAAKQAKKRNVIPFRLDKDK